MSLKNKNKLLMHVTVKLGKMCKKKKCENKIIAKITEYTVCSLCLPFVYRDLCVELPFTLTHPKPPESPPPSRPISVVSKEGENAPVDTDLIQLDTK